MIVDQLPDGFYAVEDPDGPDQPGGDPMTLWRVLYGGIESYPRRTPYGPLPPARADRPADPEDRYNWMVQWDQLRHSWMVRVVDTIREDPIAAHLRFSHYAGRCCLCGRPLAGASRMVGVGPSCRESLPDGLFKMLLTAPRGGGENHG